MKKNKITYLIVCLFTLLTANNALLAQDKITKQNKAKHIDSPFLVIGKLPHLVKILKKHWNNQALGLTKQQKNKLLVVRKETMSSIKKVIPQISKLHNTIKAGIFKGKTPKELKLIVQKISQLKASATMVQLQCIYETNQILSKKQISTLLSF